MSTKTKKTKFRNAEEWLAENYGAIGTPEREKFDKESLNFYFGEILKARRKELKLTQAALAEKIGKKRPYISRVEKGENIKIESLYLIAKALKLELTLTPIM